MRWRRAMAGAVAAAFLAVALAGCTGSTYAYENHRSSDGSVVYFKLPTNWKVYDTQQTLSAENGPLGPSQAKQLADGAWIESVSAAPKPSATQAIKLGQRWPTATIIVRPLSPTEQDTLSYRTMRALLLGTDPLTSSTGFQVLSYDPIVGQNGVRGIRLVTNIIGTEPARTFGEVVEADRQSAWVFAIGISCQVSCWALNSRTIDQVLDSWTVKQSP